MTHWKNNGSVRSRFSALYVEEKALAHPRAKQIIGLYPQLPVFAIRHYKDIFNRKNQNIILQKDNPALILAVKTKPFLYPGPAVCQSFGQERFFLAHLMLNCPFNCAYCFLQGLYPSSHPLVFVNWEDIWHEIKIEARSGPVYVALSHDSDLLAFEPILPQLGDLISWLRENDDLPISAEVRTKAAFANFFRQNEPAPGLIFAFSLAPDTIISQYETSTPPLTSRLHAVRIAQQQGYPVRLCFDPIIARDRYKAEYAAFFHMVFSKIDPDAIIDISYGFFRMPETFFRRISKIRSDSLLYLEPFDLDNKIVTYPPAVRRAWQDEHLAIISRYVDHKRIFTAEF